MSKARIGILPDFDLDIPMPAGVKPPRVDRDEEARPASRQPNGERRVYRLKRDIEKLFGARRQPT